MSARLERYATLWIGTTCEPIAREDEDGRLLPAAYEHQVSDGPVGERSHSYDFYDAGEALTFALAHADFVVVEDDFRP